MSRQNTHYWAKQTLRFSNFFLRAMFLLSVVANHAIASDHTNGINGNDVWVRVEAVRHELETLRFHMGKPINERPEIDVRGAATREVYFQAVATFHNADRLCFDYAREHRIAPAHPASDISTEDVVAVLDATLDCLVMVRAKLGIEAPLVNATADPSKTPNDVFKAIVQANRQLNLLLDKHVAPSDVFEQVTRSIGYTFRILEHFPESQAIQAAPEYQVGMQPTDVYRQLLKCLDRVQRIAGIQRLAMLELSVNDDLLANAKPSDVYHLASLIVSELAYIHSQTPDLSPPPEIYYLGRKFPSDVYQRAGLLELQLKELEDLLLQNQSQSDVAAKGEAR